VIVVGLGFGGFVDLGFRSFRKKGYGSRMTGVFAGKRKF
jgi:hypothetical protein